MNNAYSSGTHNVATVRTDYDGTAGTGNFSVTPRGASARIRDIMEGASMFLEVILPVVLPLAMAREIVMNACEAAEDRGVKVKIVFVEEDGPVTDPRLAMLYETCKASGVKTLRVVRDIYSQLSIIADRMSAISVIAINDAFTGDSLYGADVVRSLRKEFTGLWNASATGDDRSVVSYASTVTYPDSVRPGDSMSQVQVPSPGSTSARIGQAGAGSEKTTSSSEKSAAKVPLLESVPEVPSPGAGVFDEGEDDVTDAQRLRSPEVTAVIEKLQSSFAAKVEALEARVAASEKRGRADTLLDYSEDPVVIVWKPPEINFTTSAMSTREIKRPSDFGDSGKALKQVLVGDNASTNPSVRIAAYKRFVKNGFRPVVQGLDANGQAIADAFLELAVHGARLWGSTIEDNRALVDFRSAMLKWPDEWLQTVGVVDETLSKFCFWEAVGWIEPNDDRPIDGVRQLIDLNVLVFGNSWSEAESLQENFAIRADVEVKYTKASVLKIKTALDTCFSWDIMPVPIKEVRTKVAYLVNAASSSDTRFQAIVRSQLKVLDGIQTMSQWTNESELQVMRVVNLLYAGAAQLPDQEELPAETGFQTVRGRKKRGARDPNPEIQSPAVEPTLAKAAFDRARMQDYMKKSGKTVEWCSHYNRVGGDGCSHGKWHEGMYHDFRGVPEGQCGTCSSSKHPTANCHRPGGAKHSKEAQADAKGKPKKGKKGVKGAEAADGKGPRSWAQQKAFEDLSSQVAQLSETIKGQKATHNSWADMSADCVPDPPPPTPATTAKSTTKAKGGDGVWRAASVQQAQFMQSDEQKIQIGHSLSDSGAKNHMVEEARVPDSFVEDLEVRPFSGADGRFEARYDPERKALFHGNLDVVSDVLAVEDQGWSKTHLDDEHCEWNLLTGDQIARIKKITDEVPPANKIKCSTDSGVVTFDSHQAHRLRGFHVPNQRSVGSFSGSSSVLRRWARLFFFVLFAAGIAVQAVQFPQTGPKRPAPLDEAETTIFDDFLSAWDHFKDGHNGSDPNCTGCKWWRATQGRVSQHLGPERYQWLGEKRFFAADLMMLPEKTFLGKRIRLVAVEPQTGSMQVTHVRSKGVTSLIVGWSRLASRFGITVDTVTVETDDSERLVFSGPGYVLLFDRERAVDLPEKFEEHVCKTNGILKLTPPTRPNTLAERANRTVKEAGGAARMSGCLHIRWTDIIEETVIAQKNASKLDIHPVINVVLQEWEDFQIGALIGIVLPPKKLDQLALRSSHRSLFGVIVGLDLKSSRGIWVEIPFGTEDASEPDFMHHTVVDYRSCKVYRERAYGWRLRGAHLYRKWEPREDGSDSPAGPDDQRDFFCDTPSDASPYISSEESSDASDPDDASSDLSGADDEEAMLVEDAGLAAAYACSGRELEESFPSGLYEVPSQCLTVKASSRGPEWDEPYDIEADRVFNEFGTIGPPRYVESIHEEFPDAVYSDLIDVRHVKDGTKRVRIVFNGSRLWRYDGTKFYQVEPRENFSETVVELRRKPTTRIHVKAIHMLSLCLLFELAYFDVHGAYLWVSLTDFPTFAWAGKEIRASVARVLGPQWELFNNPNTMVQLLKSLYGYVISGDLWGRMFSDALADIDFHEVPGEQGLFERIGKLDYEDIEVIVEHIRWHNEEEDEKVIESVKSLGSKDMIVGLLGVFVDDGNATGTRKVLEELRSMIVYLFELKMWLCTLDQPNRMLSFYYEKYHSGAYDGSCIISSSEYDRHNLERFWLTVESCGIQVPQRLKNVSTPSLEEILYKEDDGLLRAFGPAIVGGLSYSAYQSRIDLYFGCHSLARHLNSWTSWDDKIALRCHSYLERTVDLHEVMHVDVRDFLFGTCQMLVDADASFAGDIRNLKSTVGLLVSVIGKYGTRLRVLARSAEWPMVTPSSGHAEVAAQVPALRIGFGLYPLFSRVLTFHFWETEEVPAVRDNPNFPMRFRSDATTAISAIQKGYSKNMPYLKGTRQFNINLEFLRENLKDLLEKANTVYMNGDPYTKAVDKDTLEFHRECTMMLSQHKFRCICFCKNGLLWNVSSARCTRMVEVENTLCSFCESECRCPCWEGHEPPRAKKVEKELAMVFLSDTSRRRRRRKAVVGNFNTYGSEGPEGEQRARSKRQRVPSSPSHLPQQVSVPAPAVPLAYPVVEPPRVVVEPPRVAIPQPVNPILDDKAKCAQKILEFGESMQVDFPIENLSAVRVFVSGLCEKGRKGRVTFKMMGLYANVLAHNISLFVRGELSESGALYRHVGNMLCQAINRPAQEALLERAQNEEEISDNELTWEMLGGASEGSGSDVQGSPPRLGA